MIYEWQCSCGHITTVIRKCEERNVEPGYNEDDHLGPDGFPCPGVWTRNITGPKAIFVPEMYNPETGRE